MKIPIEKLRQFQKDVDNKHKELMIECDMLQGNINRMMVTNSKEELYEMYYWASARLGTLLRQNRKRIESKLESKSRFEQEQLEWECTNPND